MFTDILTDNISGSGNILRQLEDELLQLGKTQKTIDAKMLFAGIDNLLEQFPHFALLWHFSNTTKRFFAKTNIIKGEKLVDFVNNYRHLWTGAQQQAAQKFIETINLNKKNILLHSNSSAVQQVFYLLQRQHRPVVWQTLSSPANEGAIQATAIKKMGFEVHLIHEDAISLFVKDIDFALFGADLLFGDRFMNKTGTFALCLMMVHFNKPVYVLAEKRKRIDVLKTDNGIIEKLISESPKPDGELTENFREGIRVHNFYFELIPLSFINKVFL